jgi:hypothetical protein
MPVFFQERLLLPKFREDNMKKGILTIFILAFGLSMISGCRQHSAPPASAAPQPSASQSLSPPMPPVSSAAPGASGGIPSVVPAYSETPAPAATGAGGSIPADQAFLSYSSVAGNYDVQAPDGWTAQASGENIRFTHDWNGVQVEIIRTADPFTLDAIKASRVAELIRTGRAVDIKFVNAVTTKSGPAILVEYESNSEPASGRQVRLENQRYYFYKDGNLAAMTMWAPVGSGNQKIWSQMADMFEWRQS